MFSPTDREDTRLGMCQFLRLLIYSPLPAMPRSLCACCLCWLSVLAICAYSIRASLLGLLFFYLCLFILCDFALCLLALCVYLISALACCACSVGLRTRCSCLLALCACFLSVPACSLCLLPFFVYFPLCSCSLC